MSETELVLGINGLGRVGKPTLWKQIAGKRFTEIVVNVGREVGESLQDVIDYILRDSTHGSLSRYLFGAASGKEVEARLVDEETGLIEIEGVRIYILRSERDPRYINWGRASLVVETTGKFNYPARNFEHSKGSVWGHFSSSVRKVIVSSPLKLDDGDSMPEEVITLVSGINDEMYDPTQHWIISAASCTTTCAAYMAKPLVDAFGAENLGAYNLETIHATTGKQPVLDCVPQRGKIDPCLSRSAFNNISITSTGAAKALALVMPELKGIPSIAESIRVPTGTGSLGILTTYWTKVDSSRVSKAALAQLYQEAAKAGHLHYTETRNVSSDIIGVPLATLIEGAEIKTVSLFDGLTQIVQVHGWYDNEVGYVDRLADLIAMVANLL